LDLKKQSNLSRLLAFAGGHKKLTFLGCVLSGIAAVLGLVPYVCVWLAAREALAVYPDVSEASGIVRWGWTAVWFAVSNILVYFAALMCTHIAAFRTARNMRHTGVAHILDLPLGFFAGDQSGRLRKIIDDNAALTEDLLAHKLPDLTAAVVTPIAAVVLLFTFDWRMGLLCLLTMVLAFVCMASMMGGKNAGFFHRYQREIEKMSAEAVEYVRGIPVVKVFQQTVYSFKAFYAAIQSYSDLASQYAMSCRKGQTAFLTCINGGFALLVPAALLLASGGDGWDVLADFIFYALFAPACGGMINRIMYASESVMEANEAMMKLDQVLEQKPLEETKNPKKPENETVSFEHVTFQYPGTERPALNDVSFTVKEGTVTGLVGPSGGGKSTAASLIPRFWDVGSGHVQIGGVNVRDMDSQELMRHVAFVFQDTKLFKVSLLENIRMSRPAATVEEVKAAAHAAQCDDILAKLPDGLNTVVGTKGVYLSGGEAQRIALARAILKDAPIVVLDEATAFADPENEALIQKAFGELIRGKTVLMIAHRLSTVQHADKILVIDKGAVREQGSHEELLAAGGLYAEMWKDYQKAAAWKVERGSEAVREPGGMPVGEEEYR
jgi:ATP-binding cassette subfamily B protein IrtA